MNIRRATNYRALVLAAEAGALNLTAKTQEDESRVRELLKHAEDIIEQRPTSNLIFEQMLNGDHSSDYMSHNKLFPNINFECYTDMKSTADMSVWGAGWIGNDIIARGLARYKDAIEGMEFKEAMTLLARLMRFFNDNHSNTGIGDTEPGIAMQIVINESIFVGKVGYPKCNRGDWSKYLEVEPKFDYQTAEA